MPELQAKIQILIGVDAADEINTNPDPCGLLLNLLTSALEDELRSKVEDLTGGKTSNVPAGMFWLNIDAEVSK